MGMKIFDLHNDLLTSEAPKTVREVVKNNEKSGYKSIYALYKGERTLSEITDIYENAKDSGMLYAFEDASYSDTGAFECLCERVKPLYASLCWNDENEFAGGCRSGGGLKPRGVELIKMLDKRHIALDLAHANERTFFEAAEKAERIMCSHTAFDFVKPHFRNIDEKRIERILRRKGIVGVCFVGYFLTDERGLEGKMKGEQAFYEAIDGFLQKFGDDGLCIGSDFYGSDFLVFDDYGSFADRFESAMKRIGAGRESVEKILFRNALDFFGAFDCNG